MTSRYFEPFKFMIMEKIVLVHPGEFQYDFETMTYDEIRTFVKEVDFSTLSTDELIEAYYYIKGNITMKDIPFYLVYELIIRDVYVQLH